MLRTWDIKFLEKQSFFQKFVSIQTDTETSLENIWRNWKLHRLYLLHIAARSV